MGECVCGRTHQGRGLCPACARDERWEDEFERTLGSDEDPESEPAAEDDEADGTLTDGGVDEVLVRSQSRSNRSVYHYPDPEDPRKPRCRTKKVAAGKRFMRFPVDRLSDAYTLCDYCNPDHEIDRSNRGQELAAQLRRMDADDLVTDGGSKYINPTGEGYHTTRLVGQSGFAVSLADTDLSWSIGTQIAICERPRSLVVQPAPVDGAVVLATATVRSEQYEVRHAPVPLTALAVLGVAEGEECRVYEEPDRLVVVDRADDPREPGGEDGGT